MFKSSTVPVIVESVFYPHTHTHRALESLNRTREWDCKRLSVCNCLANGLVLWVQRSEGRWEKPTVTLVIDQPGGERKRPGKKVFGTR